MSKPETMSAAVIEVIDEYPDGHQFYENQLKDDVVRIFPDAINMFPDTVLRMARRHRRDAFRVVNRNNSLYEKNKVKSIIEQIREVASPREEIPVRFPEPMKQGELLFFNQVFLVVFFILTLGVVFTLDADPGRRPRTSWSRISSIAPFEYKAAEPIYRSGLIPNRFRRFLAASEDIPKLCDISKTVIKSIYKSISIRNTSDQEKNVEKPDILPILQYRRIVKKVGQNDTWWVNLTHKKFIKIFLKTLTGPLGWGILSICPTVRTSIKTGNGVTGSRKGPRGVKGDFYGRVQKFSRMA
jgi:hypothetical protein